MLGCGGVRGGGWLVVVLVLVIEYLARWWYSACVSDGDTFLLVAVLIVVGVL